MRENLSKPVPLKSVLKHVLGAHKSDVPRVVLSGKASKVMHALAARTGIEMNVLTDAAIMALHAALTNRPDPIHIRNERLRAWLEAQNDERIHQ